MKIMKYSYAIFLIPILSGFYIQEIKPLPLPKVKRVDEYREWADKSENHEVGKWLKSQTEYYPNGKLKSQLFLDSEGDTINMRKYTLGKDSIIVSDIWYNRILKKWMKGDIYKYEKGQTQPYLTESKDGYQCFYQYDKEGNRIEKRHVDDRGSDFGTYEYTYDSVGWMVQEVEYDFFGSERYIKRRYIYVYERDAQGKVSRQDKYFVPVSEKETETKVNDLGEQMTIYRGFSAKTKALMESVFFNPEGERTKLIEYDREDKPSFIRTYVYTYY